MSNNQQRSKALKRRLSEDGLTSSTKRNRMGDTDTSSARRSRIGATHEATSSRKRDGKNSAASRMKLLRYSVKSTLEHTPPEPDPVKKGNNNIIIQASICGRSRIISKPKSTSAPSSTTKLIKSTHIKNEVSIPKPLLSPPKKSSINDRFKRARQISHRKSEDDTVIIIDDSPGPVPRKYNVETETQKSNSIIVIDDSPGAVPRKYNVDTETPKSNNIVECKRKQVFTLERYSNDLTRLSRSFVTVSEASDNEASAKKTPIHQRLDRIRKSSGSTSSDSKTLTPGSIEKSYKSERITTIKPEVSQKGCGSPVGLKIPLHRNIFKRDRENSKDSIETDSSDPKIVKDNTEDNTNSKACYEAQGSPNKFKKGPHVATKKPYTNIQERFSRTDKTSAKSKVGSVFRPTIVIQNDIQKKSFPNTKEQSPVNIFKQESSKMGNRKSPLADSPQKNSFPSSKEQSPVNIFKQESSKMGNRKSPLADSPQKNSFPSSKEQSPVNIFKQESSKMGYRKPSPLVDSPQKNSFPSSKEQNPSNIFKQESSKMGYRKPSSLADRLARIKNQVKNAVIVIENDQVKDPKSLAEHMEDSQPESGNSRMSVITEAAAPLEQYNLHQSDKLSKSMLVQNWMDTVHSRPSASNETMSDSMLVNFDDTLLNSTVLQTEQTDDSMEWDNIPGSSSEIDKLPEPAATVPDVEREKVICVVTDTNVFMHDLPKVRDLLNLKIPGDQKLKVYLPWMVLQELDHLKDFSSQPTKSKAMAAQKFINNYLLQQDPKIIGSSTSRVQLNGELSLDCTTEPKEDKRGQSVDDVCEQRNLGKCPDDKILACCFQAKAKFESVILLTNDINLRNKALTNNFRAHTPKEIIGKLRSTRYLKIKVRLQALMSQIIFQCCREAFGEACCKMELLQDSPWPFEGCLKRFRRYWSTVFEQLLLKQCLKTIDELIFITNRGDILDSYPEDLMKFKEKVKEFLFYLQDIEQFSGSVKKMRVDIDNIVESTSAL